MRAFTLGFAAALAVAASAPVTAQTVTTRVKAGALLAVCGESRPACLTYVLGTMDSLALAGFADGAYCVPKTANNDQITAATIRYLRAHPEQQEANAASSVFAALRENYPCRR
jgi:hypothetical protein